MLVYHFLYVSIFVCGIQGKITDEDQARAWYEEIDKQQSQVFSRSVAADWAAKDDIDNKTKQEISVTERLNRQQFTEETASNATGLFDWSKFTDEKLKRAFGKLTDIGVAGMKDKAKLKELNTLIAQMEEIYAKATVEGKPFEPDLVRIMSTSRDADELLKYWKGWRESSGRVIRPKWEKYVTLLNQGYKDAGSKDAGEAWKSVYEYETTTKFEEDLDRIWNEVKPLYRKIHAYVRLKLDRQYGNKAKLTSRHLKAHLLGDMWSQSWEQIFDIVKPFNRSGLDVTKAMQNKKWTVKKMFQESEKFFVNLGMVKMNADFWTNSVIKKPTDRKIVCYAMAEDFLNGKDFRIKMCTEVTQADLNTVHHEMGHIEYFMLYKDQYVLFRDGANPGFHEALGDLMTLSVNTPEHLKGLGLVGNDYKEDNETNINFLLKMALQKVVFLPYALINDKWRWKVFGGKVAAQDYNVEWWKMKCSYQGIANPRVNNPAYFDPGAKYHISSNVPYIRYFVSFIVQFQFHQALCKSTKVPLHKCDISTIPNVATNLVEALKLGSSKKWPEALKMITGDTQMSAKAMLADFQPLNDWLTTQLSDSDIGWNEKVCPNSDNPQSMAIKNQSSIFYILLLVIISCVKYHY